MDGQVEGVHGGVERGAGEVRVQAGEEHGGEEQGDRGGAEPVPEAGVVQAAGGHAGGGAALEGQVRLRTYTA